jgi:hypothetical protein
MSRPSLRPASLLGVEVVVVELVLLPSPAAAPPSSLQPEATNVRTVAQRRRRRSIAAF